MPNNKKKANKAQKVNNKSEPTQQEYYVLADNFLRWHIEQLQQLPMISCFDTERKTNRIPMTREEGYERQAKSAHFFENCMVFELEEVMTNPIRMAISFIADNNRMRVFEGKGMLSVAELNSKYYADISERTKIPFSVDYIKKEVSLPFEEFKLKYGSKYSNN
jgi:hypothetical protein